MAPPDAIDRWLAGRRAVKQPQAGGGVTPGGTPVTQPAKEIQAGGYTPDYGALIRNHPLVSQMEFDLAGAGAGDAARRQAMIRRFAVMYGGALSPEHDPFGDIDQVTRDLASRNDLSTLTALGRRYDQGLRDTRAGMASRGTLGSGHMNWLQRQAELDRAKSEQDALNEVLGWIGGVNQEYAQAEAERARTRRETILGVTDQVTEANPAVPAAKAQLDPTLRGPKGEWVYVGADGRHYDQNGNPLSGVGRTGATVPVYPDGEVPTANVLQRGRTLADL